MKKLIYMRCRITDDVLKLKIQHKVCESSEDKQNYIVILFKNQVVSSAKITHEKNGLTISSLFTKVGYRCKGYATNLINTVKIKCYTQNLMWVYLGVYSTNDTAINLYKKCNFKEYNGCVE